MSWNYRVIRSAVAGHDPVYEINEVHYDNGKPKSWSERPASVISDERMGILKVLAMMADAVMQPVLEVTPDGLLAVVEPERIATDELAKAIGQIMDFEQ